MAKQAWANLAINAIRSGGGEVPSATDLSNMKEEHNNAGMAIWLGNFLDVIPESFVIGTVMLLTLVGALFLGNFP